MEPFIELRKIPETTRAPMQINRYSMEPCPELSDNIPFIDIFFPCFISNSGGENFPGEIPTPVSTALARPGIVQVTLMASDGALNQSKHQKAEDDCGNSKDHVFDGTLSVAVTQNRVFNSICEHNFTLSVQNYSAASVLMLQ